MPCSKTRWLMVAGACLLLFPTAASAQQAEWETAVVTGYQAFKAGRQGEAEKMFLIGLREAEKFGPNDERLAVTLNALALLYQAQRKYAEAVPLSKRALAIFEKALPPADPQVAETRATLLELYTAQGKYAEAEPLHQRALAIDEKALGPEHLRVAVRLLNYAKLLRKMERHAEAEKMEARARAIRTQQARGNPEK